MSTRGARAAPATTGAPAAWVAPVAAALVTLAIAMTTLLRGVAFWDTAELQTVGPLLGTAHPTGYPTYVILGWLASVILQPFGEPAFRMNLLATLLAAMTAGLCAFLVGQLTRRALLAAGCGIVFGALPVAWGISTHADAHGLHAALIALLLVLLVGWEERLRWASPLADRWLVAAAVVFGMALGNHSLTLFLVPGIGLFVLAAQPGILGRRRFVATCIGAALLTAALLYLELPLRAGPFRAPLVYGAPETPVGLLYVVLGVQFTGTLNDPFGDPIGKLAELYRFGEVQLGPLAVLVPVGLLASVVRRPRYSLLTIPAFLLTCWFAASYENADIERYYLVPALIVVTWLAILADALIEIGALLLGERDDHAGPGPRALVLELMLAVVLVAPTLAALPARRVEIDRSGDRAAADWLDTTLPQLRQDAVVVSWWNFSTPLWYAQLIEGRRRDVEVIDDRTRLDKQLGEVTDVIDANLGRRPVYLIRELSELPALAARYRLEYLVAPPYQSLVRVIGPREGGS